MQILFNRVNTKILKAFPLGMLAALSALVLEFLILVVFPTNSNPLILFSLDIYLWLAMLVEEFFKIIFTWKIFQISQNRKKALLATLIFAISFSATEIGFNLLSPSSFNLELFLNYLNLGLIHLLTILIYLLYFFQKNARLNFGIGIVFLIGYAAHILFNLSIEKEINPLSISLVLTVFDILLLYFLAKKAKIN